VHLPGREPLRTKRAGREPLRFMTYNVHGCRGTDGVLSTGRIAEVIASCSPDVVALQELDHSRDRSGGVDQAHAIAAELGMDFHFHPALRILEEAYGDAILTACKCRLVKAGPLPGLAYAPRLEPRGALWAEVDAGCATVQVINTHLGLNSTERVAQIEALLGPEWLDHPHCVDPVVLLGDFNSVWPSRPYRRISALLQDACLSAGQCRPQATFHSRMRLLRLDYLFFRGAIEVVRTHVPATRRTRLASDHLPLVVDLLVDAAPMRTKSGAKRQSEASLA
jgi:endonuclease/exonuclease/phosphatase family metal-dependent hydrolase